MLLIYHRELLYSLRMCTVEEGLTHLEGNCDVVSVVPHSSVSLVSPSALFLLESVQYKKKKLQDCSLLQSYKMSWSVEMP